MIGHTIQRIYCRWHPNGAGQLVLRTDRGTYTLSGRELVARPPLSPLERWFRWQDHAGRARGAKIAECRADIDYFALRTHAGDLLVWAYGGSINAPGLPGASLTHYPATEIPTDVRGLYAELEPVGEDASREPQPKRPSSR